MNLNIEKFRDSLIQLVNNCNLPIGVAVYVFKDIHNLLMDQYDETLQKERQVSTNSVVEYNITPTDNNIIEILEE